MHLFYRCHKIKHVLDELKHIFNIIFEKNIVLVEENLILGVYEGEITEDLLLVNLVICILKWVTSSFDLKSLSWSICLSDGG